MAEAKVSAAPEALRELADLRLRRENLRDRVIEAQREFSLLLERKRQLKAALDNTDPSAVETLERLRWEFRVVQKQLRAGQMRLRALRSRLRQLRGSPLPRTSRCGQ